MDRKAFYFDLLERSLWTFAQAFLGVWIASGAFSAEVWQAAGVAGLIAVAKALIAPRLPWTASDTASTLPAAVDPPDAPHTPSSAEEPTRHVSVRPPDTSNESRLSGTMRVGSRPDRTWPPEGEVKDAGDGPSA